MQTDVSHHTTAVVGARASVVNHRAPFEKGRSAIGATGWDFVGLNPSLHKYTQMCVFMHVSMLELGGQGLRLPEH